MDYKVTDTELTNVADAIRAKGGTTSPLEWDGGYVSAINAIPTGGGDITTGIAWPRSFNKTASTARSAGFAFDVTSTVTIVGFLINASQAGLYNVYLSYSASELIKSWTFQVPEANKTYAMSITPYNIDTAEYGKVYMLWASNAGAVMKYGDVIGKPLDERFTQVADSSYYSSSMDTYPTTRDVSSGYPPIPIVLDAYL